MARRRAAADVSIEPPKHAVRQEWPLSLPFVIFERDKFLVNPQAVAFLESLGNKPLAVVALAGPYRHGKSFLLNRVILQHPPGVGFDVGETVNACTKGLHLSTQVLAGSNSVDGDYHVMVVDTEGLGAMSASDTHDARIFSLALLLSSMFLYNSKGTIDQPAINTLSLVANISDHIRTSSAKSPAEGKDELSAFFPTFLWVVRDFSLDLVDEHNNPIKPDEYLESALRPVEGMTAEKNRVRTSLRHYFKHRTCVTMVRPCDDEKTLKTLNVQPNEHLKPLFLEQAAALREKVMMQARPKQTCGTKLTGSLLAKLATVYCTAINSGVAPAIQDSWSLISGAQCQKAVADGEAAFLRLMEAKKIPPPPDKHGEPAAPVPAALLESVFVLGFDAAAVAFKATAIGDRVDEYRDKLRDILRKHAERLRSDNAAVVARKAEELCLAMEGRLIEQPSFEEARKTFAGLEASFFKQVGVDPAARAAWSEQTARRVWDWATRYYAKLSEAHATAAARLEYVNQQHATMEKDVILAREALETFKVHFKSLQDANNDMTAHATQLKAELAAQLDEAEQAETRHRENIRLLHETLETDALKFGGLQRSLDEALSREASITGTVDAMHDELAVLRAEKSELQKTQQRYMEQTQRLQSLEQAKTLLQRQAADLTAQLNRNAEEFKSELVTLANDSKETIRHLQEAKEHAAVRVKDAEYAAAEVARHVEGLKAEKSKCAAELLKIQHDLEATRDAANKDRAESKAELSEVRNEATRNIKQFQKQLEENAAQHREESRKRANKAREEQERLFQEKVTAASRAQNAEARVAHMEETIKDLKEQMHRERERLREQNYPGKVSELETKLSTATTRTELLQASCAEKSDIVADQSARITDLEAELRQIHQRHEAEKMRMELDHARQMGGK
jgi:hypothetical protein